MSKDINCPYCDTPQDINHDDGRGYTEDEKHKQQCVKCDKNFVFTTSISFYYEAEKADCLNGAEHDFKPTMTIPRECTRMQCSMCEATRQPTKAEMEKILTETT